MHVCFVYSKTVAQTSTALEFNQDGRLRLWISAWAVSLKFLGCTGEHNDIEVSPNVRQVTIEKQCSSLALSYVDRSPSESSAARISVVILAHRFCREDRGRRKTDGCYSLDANRRWAPFVCFSLCPWFGYALLIEPANLEHLKHEDKN